MKSLFGIRLVFLAAVLVSLAPFLASRVWGIRSEFEERLSSVNRSMVASMARSQKQLVEAKSDMSSLVTAISMMPSLTTIAPSTCNGMLRNFVENQTKIERVTLVYPSGVIFCSSDKTFLGLSEADQDYFQKALKNETTVWSDLTFNHITGRPALLAARSVHHNDAIDYVLIVASNLTTLRQSISDQFDLPVSQTSFIDEDGALLFRDAYLNGTQPFGQTTIDRIRKLDMGIIQANTFDAGYNVIGVSRLPGTTARLAVSVAVGNVYNSVRRDVFLSMVIVIAEALIIVVLVMLALDWLILRGLRQMIDVSRRISTGDLTSRVNITSTLPELSSLSTSINLMVESLEQAALADSMTGLANRRALDLHIDRCIRRQTRYGPRFSLVMIDIDNFKAFNDHYGHGVGDDVLRAVGNTLNSFARRTDEIAARYGGEEFTLVLTETDADKVFFHMERLREAVADLNISHESSPFGVVTISAGFTVTRASDSGGSALARADRALYRAKQTGRNKVQFEPAEPDHPSDGAGGSPALIELAGHDDIVI